MRLKTLTVSGFRGFAQLETIDLDADTVIVFGANGSGKTSLLDAILWALTGTITRLRGDSADIVSKYSESGEARVELELQNESATMRVTRRFDGDGYLTIENYEGQVTTGDAADAALIDLIWPDSKTAINAKTALSRSLTRAMYLQQDVVREFVDTDDDQDRFDVVGELVGVGRVTELQRAMEGSRKAWSEATNRLERDLDAQRGQVSALEERLRRLAPDSGASFGVGEYGQWMRDASGLIPEEDAKGLQGPTAEAVDATVSVLQSRQRQQERTVASLRRLIDHLRTPSPDVTPTEPLRAQVEGAEALVAQASNQLRLAEELAASERRRQAELRDSAESLRTLAQLALNHLESRCPVCQQEYDVESTRTRLESLVGQQQVASRTPSDVVQAAATELESLQRSLSNTQAMLRSAEVSEANRARWDQTSSALATDAGLEVTADVLEHAESALVTAQSSVQAVQHLLAAGEQFSLQLARTAEQAQRAELAEQLNAMQEDLRRRETAWESRGETGKLVSSIITGLRGAGNAIVTQELSRIDPLLQRIYATVDPHPSFRAVQFLTGEKGGRGRVWTTLTDQTEGKTVRDPSLVLSSSQLNVLAVSTFLALNLSIDSLPLQVAALDDPLQSLDTVNLLGLADLLRRVRTSRQVIVSTHDGRLASLLSRKLRPTAGSRTRMIKLGAWSRSGPIVEQSDVRPDAVPLKLVASA